MAIFIGTIFPIAFFVIFNVKNIDFKEYLNSLFTNYEITEEYQKSSIFIKLSSKSNQNFLLEETDQAETSENSLISEEDRKIN